MSLLFAFGAGISLAFAMVPMINPTPISDAILYGFALFGALASISTALEKR